MPRRLTHLRTMKRAWRVLLQCSLLFVLPAFFAGAQEVKPTGEQISMKWGELSTVNGVRTVVSTEAEYNAAVASNRPISIFVRDHVDFQGKLYQ